MDRTLFKKHISNKRQWLAGLNTRTGSTMSKPNIYTTPWCAET